MLILTDENFEKEISESQKPVLVDFWSEWCLPCQIFSSVLEGLDGELKEKIIFAKANIDETPLISQKFRIDVVPTVMLFKEGRLLGRFSGASPGHLVKKWLAKNLQNEMRAGDGDETEKLPGECEEFARQNGFGLNPDRELVERLIKGMKEKEKKFGKRYCCCKRITGDAAKDAEIICPCANAKKEIEEQGRCFCGLFVKKEKF